MKVIGKRTFPPDHVMNVTPGQLIIVFPLLFSVCDETLLLVNVVVQLEGNENGRPVYQLICENIFLIST